MNAIDFLEHCFLFCSYWHPRRSTVRAAAAFNMTSWRNAASWNTASWRKAASSTLHGRAAAAEEGQRGRGGDRHDSRRGGGVHAWAKLCPCATFCPERNAKPKLRAAEYVVRFTHRSTHLSIFILSEPVCVLVRPAGVLCMRTQPVKHRPRTLSPSPSPLASFSCGIPSTGQDRRRAQAHPPFSFRTKQTVNR
jgi:hypothetical protein